MNNFRFELYNFSRENTSNQFRVNKIRVAVYFLPREVFDFIRENYT